MVLAAPRVAHKGVLSTLQTNDSKHLSWDFHLIPQFPPSSIMLRIFKIISRKPASRDQENSPPATPTTPSRFLSHLSKHPDKPTRQLLQPYLEYETWLRKIFTTPSFSIGGTGDLVSVYGWRQSSIRIRTTDRNETTMARYIMPLKDEQRLPEGVPAIAASFAEFQYQFEAFTHGKVLGQTADRINLADQHTWIKRRSQRDR